MTVDHIFVYCHDRRHPGRRVPVANYELTGTDYRWADAADSHTFLDEAFLPDEDPLAQPARRSRIKMECRRCRVPLTVRGQKLYDALDGLAGAGLQEVPLSSLRQAISKLGNASS